MMFMFCVKTGILFLILCEVSGLPYDLKKIGDGNLKLEYQPGGESEADSNRLKRTPYGFPDEDEDEDIGIESRFGGRGFQKGGHSHGFVGFGHPGRRHWGFRHGLHNHPIFGHDHHLGHHDSNFGHHDSNFGHHDSNFGQHDRNFGQHDRNFGQHDTSFNHHPDWHKNHPQFDHDHQNCNHDHGYGQQPWSHNFPNGENTSKYPMTTNTLSAGGKTNNEGFGDVKPVSEPNIDIDGTMGGIFTNSVTTSTKYPEIDIRAGV